MRISRLPHALIACLASLAFATEAAAEPVSMDVTVTYRERIALPPDAELDVRLVDVSSADAVSRRISSQRFVMRSVPMTVALPYDPQVIDDRNSYAVIAEIWSGRERIFRTTDRHDPFDPTGAGETSLVLTMVPPDEDGALPPRSISGVQWAATKLLGEPWNNEDPATLVIDDEMNFSAFGGCNRFQGQLLVLGGEIAFPSDFAGTLMACPDEVEKLERRFLDVLTRASGYVRYGAGLVMTDAHGNALLHLEQRPE